MRQNRTPQEFLFKHGQDKKRILESGNNCALTCSSMTLATETFPSYKRCHLLQYITSHLSLSEPMYTSHNTFSGCTGGQPDLQRYLLFTKFSLNCIQFRKLSFLFRNSYRVICHTFC